jgi:hypothetical protein
MTIALYPDSLVTQILAASTFPEQVVAADRWVQFGGLRYACLGIFTLDGRAVGAYGRIASKPLIDHDAQDIAVLIRRKDHGKNDRKRTV